MTEHMIKAMAERFLAWKLPEDFYPDAGIRFDPQYNVGTEFAAKHEPTGTNLFTLAQAESMIRHLFEGSIRPEVAAFAWRMEQALRRKDGARGGNSWQKHTLPEEILPHLQDRVERIEEYLKEAALQRDCENDVGESMNADEAAGQAVHAANFAMMIADICDPLTRREASAKEST